MSIVKAPTDYDDKSVPLLEAGADCGRVWSLDSAATGAMLLGVGTAFPSHSSTLRQTNVANQRSRSSTSPAPGPRVSVEELTGACIAITQASARAAGATCQQGGQQ